MNTEVSPAEMLPAREPGSRRVYVIIDTPAGSRNKYKYEFRITDRGGRRAAESTLARGIRIYSAS